MVTVNNVHQQFASFFKSDRLKPLAYIISKKLSEGHISVNIGDIENEPDITTYYSRQALQSALADMQHEPLITTAGSTKQPFVLHNDKLYMQRYFNYETIILNRIHQFIAAEKNTKEVRTNLLQTHRKEVQELFAAGKKENNTNWQLVAAISTLLNNFTIITGGPGTGKTTTVAKILFLLYTTNPTLKVALAAPTGKAAARMAESVRLAAAGNAAHEKFKSLAPVTLHRLLKLSPGATACPYDQQNPLEYDLVIVDESSMIDVSLFAKLLNAIGNDTRLILLGDKDQLASVEAGSLFGDLCNALPALNIFSSDTAAFINSFFAAAGEKIAYENIGNTHRDHPLFQHIIELRHSHRFSIHQGIGRFSRAIIQDDTAVIDQFFKKGFDKQVTIDTDYSDKLFSAFALGYQAYIQEKNIATALQKLNNLRVLCAVREGANGLYAVNKKVELLLQQKGLIAGIGEFYEHRPIMVTKNYYDLQLFNGDTGIIRFDKDGVAKAWFLDSDQNLRSVLPAFVAESETVFATTIHKSQGSEFNSVLVMLPEAGDVALLTRELFYTAVTRAKQQVLIQGSKDVILQTATRTVKRVSGIAGRFYD